MKKSQRIPTILGVLVLVIGLVSGVYLINSQQEFNLGATAEIAPKNVRVSNITDKSFTVSWTTDIETSAFIKWGTNENILNKVVSQEAGQKGRVHSLNVSEVEPNTTVYFKINSNGTDFDNNKIAWQARTLPNANKYPSTIIASGTILDINGASGTKALVYITINGQTVSAITSDQGSWIVPLHDYFSSFNDTQPIQINAINADSVSSSAVIYLQAIKNIPVMILGQSYDFRTLDPKDQSNLPSSNLQIPNEVQKSSRFVVDRSTLPLSNKSVTLESIDDGEIINTDLPEFFGEGPSGTNITIELQSELQTGSVNVPSSGSWKWSPGKKLEPGEHTLNIKWVDTNGITRTITRKFIVQAAEGPAFVSTPSATPVNSSPTASATATASSSSTPKASISATPTIMPTPVTGSLTPTIGLFIMGIGVLFSSIYIWNKADA